MEFPKVNFRSEKACFEALLKLVHPAGFGCPRCQASGGMQIHENHRQPWHIRYRCSLCNKEFNVWTGIRLHGTHRPPSEILRIMQGIVKGKSNSQMAREL